MNHEISVDNTDFIDLSVAELKGGKHGLALLTMPFNIVMTGNSRVVEYLITTSARKREVGDTVPIDSEERRQIAAEILRATSQALTAPLSGSLVRVGSNEAMMSGNVLIIPNVDPQKVEIWPTPPVHVTKGIPIDSGLAKQQAANPVLGATTVKSDFLVELRQWRARIQSMLDNRSDYYDEEEDGDE